MNEFKLRQYQQDFLDALTDDRITIERPRRYGPAEDAIRRLKPERKPKLQGVHAHLIIIVDELSGE